MGIFPTFKYFHPPLTICLGESIFKVLIRQSIITGENIMKLARFDGRAIDQLRSVRITPGFLKHAEGSALIELG